MTVAPSFDLSRDTIKQMPRVGVITNSLSTAAGGLFFSVREIANLLETRGVEQCVFGLEDSQFDSDRKLWYVSQLNAFKGWGPARFKVSGALLRRVFDAKIDVLHLHGIWNFSSLAAFLWQTRSGGALLVSPHGMLDPGALTFSPMTKRIVGGLYERRGLGRARAIHALNEQEAQAVRAFGLDMPIAVIPNGVRLPSAAVLTDRDWNGDDRRTMLFLARLHPKKGVEELIAAWRKMLDDAPQIGKRWRLKLAGWDDGGMIDIAREQIAALDLHDHVDLPGGLFGQEKHDAFANAHAFILPSRSEGLPVSVLEAWAYGLPVFMTDACNIPSGFAVGAAVRVEVHVEALASRLTEHLLADTARLREMGGLGRLLVARDFAWDRIADAYLSVYQWLAKGGPVPSCVQFAPDKVSL